MSTNFLISTHRNFTPDELLDDQSGQLKHNPQIRSCINPHNESSASDLFSDPATAAGVLIILIICALLLLGLLKGLLGSFCCPPIGMCGLGALIDLPRPLQTYQEEELRDFPVKYDLIGWPVHPQTDRRTVRAISKRTEFCLNLIFFLAYPLITLLTLLSLCCFQRAYDTADTSNQNYKRNHQIMLTGCPTMMCITEKSLAERDAKCFPRPTSNGVSFSNKEQRDRLRHTSYSRGDSSAEDYDTQYVMQQMRKSEEVLNK